MDHNIVKAELIMMNRETRTTIDGDRVVTRGQLSLHPPSGNADELFGKDLGKKANNCDCSPINLKEKQLPTSDMVPNMMQCRTTVDSSLKPNTVTPTFSISMKKSSVAVVRSECRIKNEPDGDIDMNDSENSGSRLPTFCSTAKVLDPLLAGMDSSEEDGQHPEKKVKKELERFSKLSEDSNSDHAAKEVKVKREGRTKSTISPPSLISPTLSISGTKWNTLKSYRNRNMDSRRPSNNRSNMLNEWWAYSASEGKAYKSKETHLARIETTQRHADMGLQMLLWDLGFEYEIYDHQFEAIRVVAGLAKTFPLELESQESNDLLGMNEIGAMRRLDALLAAAKEASLWHVENEIDMKIRTDVDECCKKLKYTLPTQGILLADEMGLGKTIEALAGSILRSAMQNYSDLSLGSTKKLLPTLIVSPQDGIQNQWYNTLVKSGVDPSRIQVLGDTKAQTNNRQNQNESSSRNSPFRSNPLQGGSFILCTMHKVQTELKQLFASHESNNVRKNKKARLSKNDSEWHRKKHRGTSWTNLFPYIPESVVGKLRNQYRADKGKEQNLFRKEKERRQDCIARLIREGRKSSVNDFQNCLENLVTTSCNSSSLPFAFQTIIVDEAHFFKNILAFWGLGLALLGSQSKRTVLLTGTPFNNGTSDMAALMTYIDPRHEAASIDWWEDAVSLGSSSFASKVVTEWRKRFMLRRTKEVLEHKLPQRIRKEVDVRPLPSELWIYEVYERKFINALKSLTKNMMDDTPESRHRVKKNFEVMMACMACMRMALVHPILLDGREATISFSPSRKHILNREERPKRCVFCSSTPSALVEAPLKSRDLKRPKMDNLDPLSKLQSMHESDDGVLETAGNARTSMDLDDDQLNDEDFEPASSDKRKGKQSAEEKKKGSIVPLGPGICQASNSKCRHFAHKKCIEKFVEENGTSSSCPRCRDLRVRLHDCLPNSIYCEENSSHILGRHGGFKASTKIQEAISWLKNTVPADEKAIILSFFKGGLDLIEGILVEDLGIECARYDGDVSKDARTRDLERFKRSKTCRVLLATVQSGGTGLNITEANHVCFLDRWFNPCVHDQAESRCHRIGQTKDVSITYLDTNLTVDIVMKRVNVLKEGNASVVLADGTSLGDRWSLGYRNVSGEIGNTLKALAAMRADWTRAHGDKPLPRYDEFALEKKLEEQINAKVLPVKLEPNKKTNDEDLKPCSTISEAIAPSANKILPLDDNLKQHLAFGRDCLRAVDKDIGLALENCPSFAMVKGPRRKQDGKICLDVKKSVCSQKESKFSINSDDDDDDDDSFILNRGPVFGKSRHNSVTKAEKIENTNISEYTTSVQEILPQNSTTSTRKRSYVECRSSVPKSSEYSFPKIKSEELMRKSLKGIGNKGHKIASSNLKDRFTEMQTRFPIPLGRGEYDVVIPFTTMGLMLKIKQEKDAVRFHGYRRFPDGSKSLAEERNIVRNVGDKIMLIDGEPCAGKTLEDIAGMIRIRMEARKTFVAFRFLSLLG